jgi:hypothetical protein
MSNRWWRVISSISVGHAERAFERDLTGGNGDRALEAIVAERKVDVHGRRVIRP